MRREDFKNPPIFQTDNPQIAVWILNDWSTLQTFLSKMTLPQKMPKPQKPKRVYPPKALVLGLFLKTHYAKYSALKHTASIAPCKALVSRSDTRVHFSNNKKSAHVYHFMTQVLVFGQIAACYLTVS